jgi:hypothetical protein
LSNRGGLDRTVRQLLRGELVEHRGELCCDLLVHVRRERVGPVLPLRAARDGKQSDER